MKPEEMIKGTGHLFTLICVFAILFVGLAGWAFWTTIFWFFRSFS